MTEASGSFSSEYTSDSSIKTGSSNATTHSSIKGEIERDDGSSPIDMECNIQADRITKSLDKLVYQTKLAICIRTLLCNNILTDILTETHLDLVRSTVEQYELPLDSESLTNMAAVEDTRAGNMSLKNRINPDLCFMMYALCSYPELKPHVERITAQLKKDFTQRDREPVHVSYANMNISENPSFGVKYLLKLEEFRDLMVAQMKTTAAEELSAVINTRKLEKSNNECLEKITDYKKYLEDEKRDHEDKIRQKSELIVQLKQELELSDHKASIMRKKQILDSERQMVLATRAHVVKYQMLKEEEVESRDIYHNSLNHSLMAEKLLRDRRRKCETQLQSWLQKYDVEMTAKQEELDELIKMYEDEVEQGENLTIKLEEQNKEFEPLMAEREEEYHQEMTEKLNAFIIEHAARVIQVAWRDTLRNRAEKKKLLKLKKKMEAEREAAEIRAELEAKRAAANAKKQAAKDRAEAKAAAKAAKLEATSNKEKEGQATPAEGQEKQ